MTDTCPYPDCNGPIVHRDRHRPHCYACSRRPDLAPGQTPSPLSDAEIAITGNENFGRDTPPRIDISQYQPQDLGLKPTGGHP